MQQHNSVVAKLLSINHSDAFISEFNACLRQQPFKAGQVVIEQGAPVQGLLLIHQGVIGHYADRQKIIESTAGGELGELTLRDDKPWEVTLIAETDLSVSFLDSRSLRPLCSEYADQLQTVPVLKFFCDQQKMLGETLHRNKALKALDETVLRELEEQMPFRVFEGGSTLFREGEASDDLYLVMSGRLKAVVRREGQPTLALNDIVRGQSVGEIGLILHQARSADVVAMRDTTVAVLNRELFNALLKKYPLEINRAFSHVILSHFNVHGADRKSSDRQAETFALFPSHDGIDLLEVADGFADALAQFSGTCLIWRDGDYLTIKDSKGRLERCKQHDASIIGLLDRLEYEYVYVIYVSDNSFNEWSQLCLRQADQLLLVTAAENAQASSPIEQQLSQQANYEFLKKHLILLQKDTPKPSNTFQQNARRLESYFHIRPNRQQDYQRMARCFAGKAIGLVMGGGGARGMAHIGLVKAFKELAIPIDYIGGNSMGAWIGSQFALNRDENDILKHLLQMAKMGERLTFPFLSLFSGKFVKKTIQEICGDILIEDLWTPFFSVSCNLTRAKLKVHNRGLLWEAVLASNSAPGILPPQRDGDDLLVEGAFLNNVPVDIMKNTYKNCLAIAADVSVREELIIDEGVQLNDRFILKNKLNPFAPPVKFPNIFDILTRASIIAALDKQNEAKKIADLYLQPPVSNIPLTSYKQGAAIAQIGYEYGMEVLPQWWEQYR